MANLELPFGIKVLNPTSLDAKYLNDGVVYTGVTQVNTLISSGTRHIGLTVNISGVEYWYKDGITDPDLIIKSGSGTGGTDIYVSGATLNVTTLELHRTEGLADVTVDLSSLSGGTSLETFITTSSDIVISSTATDKNYIASGTTGYTLPASPIINEKVTFSDGLGTAGTISINISGNGKNIIDDTFALLNTDYGSFTIIYNGMFWNVTSHVP